MTNILLAISTVWSVTMTIAFCWMTRRAMKEMLAALDWQKKFNISKIELASACTQRDIAYGDLYSARMMLEFERNMKKFPVTIYAPALDDKTAALVRLAVGNPEKNEGANAAMLACKRLAEKIK